MESQPLLFSRSLEGISEQTLAIHHDKLYAGYVNKTNDIRTALVPFESGTEDLSSANASYSKLRSLKTDETFTVNGVYLHEYYFNILGGDGAIPSNALTEAIAQRFGSMEQFVAYFSACGMSARGWSVLAWDTHSKTLEVYNADAHNQGGIWGCFPVLVLDVYEHAYFIDKGSDRKSYIEQFWKNLDWTKANEYFARAIKP